MDMEFYAPRKLKFKAWNTETNLLMRLHSIDCIKGELFKTNHILLQFTGLYDMQKEEIYDMDVLLFKSEKFIVHWNNALPGWMLTKLEDNGTQKLDERVTSTMKRLCSYFESAKTL